MKMTEKEFVQYCKEHTPLETGRLLRRYVAEGQPDDFLPASGTRSMCYMAANAYRGRHGGYYDYMDFYQYMWTCSEDEADLLTEAGAESRKIRHIRCGIPLNDAPAS